MNDNEKAARIHELMSQRIDEGKMLCEAFDSLAGTDAFKRVAVEIYDQIMSIAGEIKKDRPWVNG